MIEPRNQQDIVNNFLRNTDNGKVVEDILDIPSLGEAFCAPPAECQVIVEQVRTPDLANIRPGREAAIMFINMLAQHSGVVKIVWSPGGSHLQVHCALGFKQHSSMSDDDLVQAITNIMKARANITKLSWELSSGEIEISYINPAQC